jgi:hypothetical protein
MIRKLPPKHPASSKWYWFTWSSDELQGEAIASSTWQVPAPLTKDSEMLSGNKVGIKLGGGVEGDDYEIVNQISTASDGPLHQRIRISVNDSGH